MGKKLVINNAGLYDVRQQPRVRVDLMRRAEAVAAAAGGREAGYLVNSDQGEKNPQGRWRATVYTATARAMVSNAKHNILVRAFGAARG
ncbi:hypothetical protein [Nocardia concava]|uniref:hypothetical protein n=1 Tax=Nocardia concava TaxID=257281 RepID=UPI000305B57B|nr:hypothetical protein [Nocardia concava]